MAKFPTWVNSGFHRGSGHTQRQNHPQLKEHSQWHSWMQYGSSCSSRTIPAKASALRDSTASSRRTRAPVLDASAAVALANSKASVSEVSIFSSGKTRHRSTQTQMHRQLHSHSQMTSQNSMAPAPV